MPLKGVYRCNTGAAFKLGEKLISSRTAAFLGMDLTSAGILGDSRKILHILGRHELSCGCALLFNLIRDFLLILLFDTSSFHDCSCHDDHCLRQQRALSPGLSGLSMTALALLLAGTLQTFWAGCALQNFIQCCASCLFSERPYTLCWALWFLTFSAAVAYPYSHCWLGLWEQLHYLSEFPL